MTAKAQSISSVSVIMTRLGEPDTEAIPKVLGRTQSRR
jgi:hypothetical protein